jgi:hypothetical protein
VQCSELGGPLRAELGCPGGLEVLTPTVLRKLRTKLVSLPWFMVRAVGGTSAVLFC